VLAKGTTLEMVLDRPLSFQEGELNFGNQPMARPAPVPEAPAGGRRQGATVPLPRRRFP
jgi:hypothetical protein